ncbi:6890_t:CDS:2, partial [Cetraspora pellucida]
DVKLQLGWNAKVLPNETLTQIFKDIDFPNNCIYVNHSWAFAALPFLWQSPFTIARNPIKLVETLIKSLPTEYAEWIKELQYEQLLSYVIVWFESQHRIKPVSRNQKICHSLELRSEDLSTRHVYPHLSTMLCPMQTNYESLITITELTCDTWVPENFYQTLSLRS